MTAAPASYASAQQYRERIRKADQEEDPVLQRALRAVSRIVDKKTHTFFWKDDELTTRIYEPITRPLNTNRMTSAGIGWAESENPWMQVRGDLDLVVDPIYNLADILVEVDTDRSGSYATSYVEGTDFVLYPRNALVGIEPKPYQYLKKAGGGPWIPGAAVRITAYYGWPTVPDAIVEATIELAAILRIESLRATNIVQNLDQAVEASRECQDILKVLLATYSQRPRV